MKYRETGNEKNNRNITTIRFKEDNRRHHTEKKQYKMVKFGSNNASETWPVTAHGTTFWRFTANAETVRKQFYSKVHLELIVLWLEHFIQ